MHDIVDIASMTKLGGPIVLVVAIIAGLANASGEPDGEKGEKFRSGAMLGGIFMLILVVLASTQ